MRARRVIFIPALVFVWCLLISHQAASQSSELQSDSLVRRTTMWATFLPGSGQVINKKYWKAPLVWGSLIWCISAIDFNVQEMKNSLSTLSALESDGFGPGDAAYELASERILFYRKWRDVSVLGTMAVHALGVLDAHVDANLSNFDVSDDLSLGYTFIPEINRQNFIPALTLNWRISAPSQPPQIARP